MNPFSWIRTAARNAFLGGIQDAIEQVSDAGAITVKVDLPALPDKPEEQPAKRGRKAAE